ncbi:hypothetical protein [Paraburkholderia antibiotica]|uniref:Uncharacterized protein n=1 Tax=Paraburkholderia antibiotica TaxID=2728839 RepID=A0A7Y0A1S9_9BURK|nr:hypothetical protein [Paraburkholderia antibiotica]NML34899.1 hypothetical protein [Paraburkholderia antibiotica]
MSYRSLRKFKQAQREAEYRQDNLLDAHLDPEPPITEKELAEIASDKHFERVDYPRTNRQWGTW